MFFIIIIIILILLFLISQRLLTRYLENKDSYNVHVLTYYVQLRAHATISLHTHYVQGQGHKWVFLKQNLDVRNFRNVSYIVSKFMYLSRTCSGKHFSYAMLSENMARSLVKSGSNKGQK